MNVIDTPIERTEKYGVGQPVKRTEDPRLLTGGGRYADDINLPGQAFGVLVRSTIAHGVITGLDTSEAAAAPGVLAVYTADDLTAYGDLPCALPLKSHDGRPLIVPPHPALAVGRVRHLGDPVALVVAETSAQAKDAAELVALDIDALPAVTTVELAVAPDAATIWPEEAPDNICLDWKNGDFDAVERAFTGAAHVTKLRIDNNRLVVAALEPRAAVAEYDAVDERFTLHLGAQGAFGLRNSLANNILKVPPEKMRVRIYDVGGSFGMKAPPYSEYVALLHAARTLGRPVKWCDERGESFLSDQHGRDSLVDGELALDADGNFLAARITGLANMGAYLSTVGPNVQSGNIHKNLPSCYRTPAIAVHMKCVFTNTTSVSAYRGAGRPEANYYMERLIDKAARETGHDPVELRRRNMIPADAMPFTAASGQVYDSGDFASLMDECLLAADWSGFPARRAAARERGKLRGIGLASYLEVTAPPGKEMGGIRFDADGGVTITTGTLNYGQGHAATFAQVLHDKLGVPFDQVRLLQGDSDALIAGGGTGGSRSTMASGNAILQAGDQVIAQGRALAGHFLEAAVEDIDFADGDFRVVGTDRSIPIMELARRVREAQDLPEDLPANLDASLIADTGPSSYPNGCHVCELEVDPETGAVEIARYVVVDDFGTLVNPMLVEGQVHGGVVQGIGQALMEQAVYDDDGQLLNGSFMDYAMPRADQIPDFTFASHPVPATTNALGVKGCGEAGVTGALPAVMNALVDALAEFGVMHIDMPATPERVWSALRAKRLIENGSIGPFS